MASKRKKIFYPFQTFWKILLVTLSIFILVVAYIMKSDNRSVQEDTKASVEAVTLSRSREIARAVENAFIFQAVNDLNDLAQLLQVDRGTEDQTLEGWLARQNDVLYISLWVADRKLPIRVARKGFWNEPPVQDATRGERRREFLDFFLNEDFSTTNANRSWYVGSVLPQDILGYPVVPIGVRFRDRDRIRALEMKTIPNRVGNAIRENMAVGETSAILSAGGDVLFSSPSDAKLHDGPADSTTVSWTGDYATVRYPLPNLPWVFYLGQKIQPREGPKPMPDRVLYIAAVGFIIVLLLSALISTWIDRPLKRVLIKATEIARGNFILRVPKQKNKNINQLTKLFNYMAEEMAHLQGLDVGEIINEKNKTETILRNIADGVVVTDPEDRILVINAVAEKWFGLKEKAAFHKPIQECIQNKPLISLLQDVKKGRLRSAAEFGFEVFGTGEKRVFQAHAARVHNPEEDLVGVVTVIRDITKEKEADRIKTELVSMVAHELKSPLTSIYGFSELLLESKLDNPQATEYARVILTESTRLTDLINKFLDLSRLEAGRTEIQMSPFDLRQVVDKIVETYQSQADKKGIRVIVEIPENLPLAYGDLDMIEQVLLNLFNNAIKYSPKRSKVGIEAKTEDEKILVSVIDNGYGIPKESLSHIFEKFYRVSETEGTEEIEGSGLGLTLAKVIVEMHKGTIKVNSRLGVGSVFSFTLPKAEMK
ncbi:MAG: ATP-binding protein [bacterium]